MVNVNVSVEFTPDEVADLLKWYAKRQNGEDCLGAQIGYGVEKKLLAVCSRCTEAAQAKV